MQYHSGFDYIKIACVSSLNRNKTSFSKQIKYFDVNYLDQLNKQISFDDLIHQVPVKHKITFDKSWGAALDTLNKIPTGFIMGLDAASSGLQIMAMLSGCYVTGKACNLVNSSEEAYNAYTGVYNNMVERLGGTSKILLEDVKSALMTHFYNSIAVPKKLFNEIELAVFYAVIEGAFPGAKDVMDSINSCWQPCKVRQWTLPDGFVVHDLSIGYQEYDIKAFGSSFKYSTKEVTKGGKRKALLANIIQSIDAYICREVVSRCEDVEIITIHDNFYTSPNNLNEVRQAYLDICIEITKSNLLQDILREITGNSKLLYNKIDTSNKLVNAMKTAEHAIC